MKIRNGILMIDRIKKIRYKPTGTQRSLIVARVDSIPENYHNLRTILDTLYLPEWS